MDTFHITKNFLDSNIKLKIHTNDEVILSVNVTKDNNNIISIGNYSSELTFNDYYNQIVSIPISSVLDARGKTVITVSLAEGEKTIIRTFYLYVY